jgi:hypothetical protein
MYAVFRLIKPVVSSAVRLESHVEAVPVGRKVEGLIAASEQSFAVGLLAKGPKMLRDCRAVGVVPFGWKSKSVRGSPCRLTEAVVGVRPVDVVVDNALPAFHPSKYLKIPILAHGVNTVKFVDERCNAWFISNNTKKKVLFFTIGPPKLTVP